MSTFNRRLFLTRAAGVPVAALVPSAALAAVAPSSENPRLLKLGKMLDTIEKSGEDALEKLFKARESFKEFCPALPDELVIGHKDVLRPYSEREVDMEGRDVWPPRQIVKASLLKQAVADGELPANRRTKLGKRVHRLIGVVEQFEDSVLAAREMVGADEAISALSHVQYYLRRVGSAIADTPARTMQGLAIKARAIIVTPIDDNLKNIAACWWGLPMAQDILRIVHGDADCSRQQPRIFELAEQRRAAIS